MFCTSKNENFSIFLSKRITVGQIMDLTLQDTQYILGIKWIFSLEKHMNLRLLTFSLFLVDDSSPVVFLSVKKMFFQGVSKNDGTPIYLHEMQKTTNFWQFLNFWDVRLKKEKTFYAHMWAILHKDENFCWFPKKISKQNLQVNGGP